MIHDHGLGRTTDIGEMTGQAAYNPYTAEGFNPKAGSYNFTGLGGIEQLRLRDEQGRVRDEYVPTLPQMIESIFDSGMNVVLQLDFKDETAIEPAYWALKHLTNRAGVPANEWCIYKLQSVWYQTPKRDQVGLHPGLRPGVRRCIRSDGVGEAVQPDELHYQPGGRAAKRRRSDPRYPGLHKRRE